MNSDSLDSYHHIAATLTPPAVSQYLATHDWQLEVRDQDIKEIWQLPGKNGLLGRVMLPLATDYVDFPERFGDTLRALAAIYDWAPAELAERIATTRADQFFVRVDQETVDNTIPFRQATTILSGLFRMLKAAATTAYDPNHSHRGGRPAAVTEFLDENIRFRQTGPDSLVFAVVTRLGTAQPPAVSFPRKVMITLATGLQSTQRLSHTSDDHAIARAGELGLSATLVESVLELSAPAAVSALDFSFEWASAEPVPAIGGSHIVIDRAAAMAGLPRLRERLLRRTEPPSRQTLVGVVRGLNRDDLGDGDAEATSVVLSTHINGRPRKVAVPLVGEDYEWAIRAHQSKKPIVVSGSLVFERGAWRLTGPIEVDVNQLG